LADGKQTELEKEARKKTKKRVFGRKIDRRKF
jgi:hypothetical protein